MIHNENPRVKIPALVHFARLFSQKAVRKEQQYSLLIMLQYHEWLSKEELH